MFCWKSLRKALIRITPRRSTLRGGRLHKLLGDRILQNSLWKWRRSNVSVGLAVGLFWAMIPMPMQMIPAGFCAYLLRGNLPITLASVWISNPLTLVPLLYLQHKTGQMLLPEEAPLTQALLLGWAVWTIGLPLITYSLCLIIWKKT